MRKKISVMFVAELTLLLMAVSTSEFNFYLAKATPGAPIYIKADGSVEGTDKIQRDGDVYTFTDNIHNEYGIFVERSNIIVDGYGYTLQGDYPTSTVGWGFWLPSSVNNVTIQNTNITNFISGVLLNKASFNIVSGNTMTHCEKGVTFDDCSFNIVSGNTIKNGGGVYIALSNNNIVSGNTITNNGGDGVFLYDSSFNTIFRNTIKNNTDDGVYLCESSNFNTVSGNTITNHDSWGGSSGIELWSESSNNAIYHNNFIDNFHQVYIETSCIANVWDDGYPSGGNYWSDYTGVDVKSGPGQDQPGSDGIGDTSYYIDENNVDEYPIMNPVVVYILTITTTTGGTTNPTPGTYTYWDGASRSVTAIPNNGINFDHWELDGSWNDSNPITVIMDSDHTLHAVFTYDVTIEAHCYTEGVDVSVSIDMDGLPTPENTPHTFTIFAGSHTFTVPSNDPSGHPFKEWSTGETSTTITVNTGGTYTALYQAKYKLTITTTTGGTTNPTPGTYTYWDGTEISVTATPNPDYYFDHWDIDGNNVGATNPISATMDYDHTLHAVFVPTYTLTITTAMGGTTNPSPGTHTYIAGTQVSVTAIPDTNCAFDYWELDGSWNDSNPITVIMDSDHTLHAVFTYHDVAIIDVTASPTSPSVEEPISINVTVENQGNFTETFDVSVYYTLTTDPLIGTQPVTDLLPGESRTLTFEWTANEAGRYAIGAEAPLLDDIDPADNTRTTIVYVESQYGESVNGFHIAGLLFAVFGSVIFLAFRKNKEMSMCNMPASILKQNLRNNLLNNTTNMWHECIRQKLT